MAKQRRTRRQQAFPLAAFGEYLREARLSRFPTQKDAADAISRLSGKEVSQGLVAHYEKGRVADPTPDILSALAQAYGRDYMEVVLELVRNKYAGGLGTENALPQRRLAVWKAALRPFSTVGDVPGLEHRQLQAKAKLVEESEVLDMDGMAEWQRDFPDLELYWVVVPNLLDDRNDKIMEAVIHNLQRGVQIIYFVSESEAEPGGRFERLQNQLGTYISLQTVQKRTRAVPLDSNALAWLNTDIVIANPHREIGAVGFENLRRNGTAVFAFRMASQDLAVAIGAISRYAAGKVGDVRMFLPLPKKRALQPVT